MPTLTSGINIALQAVLTQAHVMEITEHNIANASTPGYRRQAAKLSATVASLNSGLDYISGAGQRGTGVTIDRIQRFNLEFFDTRYRSVTAETKYWDAQSSVLHQTEATLAETGADGMLPKLDQFWSSWQTLSNDPTNITQRQILLDDASSLANAFNRRSAQITQLRSDQSLVVSSQVDEVNSLADQVSKLNGQISHVLSVGEQPNDLLDKRDLVLDRLSELTGSVSFNQKNGEMMVSIGGHALVVGHEAFKLETRPSATDVSIVDVYWSSDNQKLIPAGGEIKGTLDVRDNVLKSQLDGLNTLASGLITQVNGIHTTGYRLNGALGTKFFDGTNANDIAVFSTLTPDGIAASGDPDPLAVGNNAKAMEIVALKTFKGMPNTTTLNEYYNMQISQLGVATKRATDNNTQYGLVAKALSDQRESVSGVSLDEEAANMATAQKAYQAAARVLTAYDDLLDTVINRMGLVGR